MNRGQKSRFHRATDDYGQPNTYLIPRSLFSFTKSAPERSCSGSCDDGGEGRNDNQLFSQTPIKEVLVATTLHLSASARGGGDDATATAGEG